MLAKYVLVMTALVAAAMTLVGTSAVAVAEPDCEQVGVHDNPAGNAAGNGHECVGGSGDNPEPVRDCSHKNSEKDNNDNGETACIPRGNSNDGDDGD